MDLSTRYMGFELPHPLIPGASPLLVSMDPIRRLEDAGAPMIVLHSLFEEQFTCQEVGAHRAPEARESSAEALSYLPEPEAVGGQAGGYPELIARVKAAVAVPVVASVNCVTPDGARECARLIEQAGADGLELNLYEPVTDLDESGEQVERRALEVVRAAREAVRLPLAVKLSPFYSSVAHFARRLDDLGVDGLVLFNRFHQQDIDVEHLEVTRSMRPSTPATLALRLRWLGVLSGRLKAPLAISGGVHTATDAVKAVMAGAHAVQMVSALLSHGPQYLAVALQDLRRWLEAHEYASLREMVGCLSLHRCADPQAYERAHYVRTLQHWQMEPVAQ